MEINSGSFFETLMKSIDHSLDIKLNSYRPSLCPIIHYLLN